MDPVIDLLKQYTSYLINVKHVKFPISGNLNFHLEKEFLNYSKKIEKILAKDFVNIFSKKEKDDIIKEEKYCCFYNDSASLFLCSKKNCTLIFLENGFYICEDHFENKENNLLIKDIRRKDAGYFKCKIFFDNKKFSKDDYFLLSTV